MRIQKVNEHTIRIFISFNELADLDISLADLFQRSPKTEQLFWELIAQAREEVEFNLDQPFWIQATIASDDEFVITVIKQEDHFDLPCRETKKTGTRRRGFEVVFVFNEFEDLLSAVGRLPEIKHLQSELYEMEDEYFLVLRKLGPAKKRQTAVAVLEEYGEIVDITKEFLREHGTTIIPENAVEVLMNNFH